MTDTIYLDHAATAPTDPAVADAMQPYLRERFGNPSTLYRLGQEAKASLDDARERVAAVFGARPEEIVFTGCGTESDNFALEGVVWADNPRGRHIITCAIEHHAILETCIFLEKHGCDVTYLPVDGDGLVDPAAVEAAIRADTALVTIMHSNNEVGTIEPITEIGKIARERGVYMHTDAVQSAGAIATNVDELNVDMLSISAHKFYGPKGVGMLYVRKGTKMAPFIHGGGQERHRRAGTENVAGIIGLAKALEIADAKRESEEPRQSALRDKLIDGILGSVEHARLNGHRTKRLPNNVSVCFENAEGESMLLNLDMMGICASSGSACTSGSLKPSHVLVSMGIPVEVAHGSLRFTLGRGTTEEEIDRVLEVLPGIVNKLRAMSPLTAGGV